MNPEIVGKKLRMLRQQSKLSQQQFAMKYGVSCQAVSKWETARNLPDIWILKKICEDYNVALDYFFSDEEDKITLNQESTKKLPKEKRTKSKRKLIIGLSISSIIFVLILLALLIFHPNHGKDFEFKTLSTTCNNFNLYGSLAFNQRKTSIHISHLTYCGKEDDTKYEKVECTLYEMNDKTKTEISKCSLSENVPTTLDEFLKHIEFNVNHYDKTCKLYKENSLYLELDAIDSQGEISTFKIPLQLEENCKN